MILAQNCRDVILGTLLGDACLERNGKNVRLRIDHGEKQRLLVEWKFQQLADLNPSEPKRVEVFDHRTNRIYVHYRFLTKTTELLNDYFELFYGKEGAKHVPEEISQLLTSAFTLAVWYMDDGSRRSDCGSGYFNTQAFDVEEVALLQHCLMRNFNLETKIHFAAGRPRIYLPKLQFSKFCDLIRPYVIPDMRYKLL